MDTRYERLVAEIRGAGGALWTTAGHLRDLERAGRSGCHVRDRIWRKLSSRGIEVGPLPLPANQSDSVLLFDRSTHAGQVIAAGFRIAEVDSTTSEGTQPYAA